MSDSAYFLEKSCIIAAASKLRFRTLIDIQRLGASTTDPSVVSPVLLSILISHVPLFLTF